MKRKTGKEKVEAAAVEMIETPLELIKAILLKHEAAMIDVMRELHDAKGSAVRAERQRIVNLLMRQHEESKGTHNYWQVAANLIQIDLS